MSEINISDAPRFPDSELDKPATNRGMMTALNNLSNDLLYEGGKMENAAERSNNPLVQALMLIHGDLQKVISLYQQQLQAEGPKTYGKDGAAG